MAHACRLHMVQVPHRDNGAIPLAFTLKPQNSVFSFISLERPEYLQVTEFVLKLFKRTLWFQAAFHFMGMSMIFANFHSQML